LGELLRMEPCPNCGSKDNVAVYTDGKWCFGGCGYRKGGYKGMSVEDLKKQIAYRENKKKNDPISLPADYRTLLPDEGRDWLRKYGLADDEIVRHRIGWSDEYEARSGNIVHWPALILHAFDVWGNLLVYQRRTFQDGSLPKYHTSGAPEAVLWTVSPRHAPDDLLILTEDFVSAVKVGRQYQASPLWGSSLSHGQVTRISDRYSRLGLWLDWNKVSAAKMMAFKYQVYFKQLVVIATEKDPKEYDDTTIREIVLGEGLGEV
jgi:hypothetical protein